MQFINYSIRPLITADHVAYFMLVKKNRKRLEDFSIILVRNEKATPNKTRLLVQEGEDFIVLKTEDIALFYTVNKKLYAIDRQKKNMKSIKASSNCNMN